MLVISRAAAQAVVGVPPTGLNGGEYPTYVHDDVSTAQRATIQAQLSAAHESLGLEGHASGVGASVKFAWPLVAPQLDVYGFHGISNFVDQDSAFPNRVLDYNCGARSYDLASGYNHSGTDVFLWPFPWNRMENGDVHIVAAAPGTILYKQDGFPDHNCDFSNPNWNAVYVEHADGSVAWYGHMKKNSLTSKAVGAAVEQGEYLGLVGSSGSSTGPHLHFEVYDANGDLVDPFKGDCNALNADSWWSQQRSYYDSAINEITTGTAPVDLGSCPNLSTPNKQDIIVRGSTVYFTSYYRDQRNTQTADHTIYRPDNSIYSAWSHASTDPYYSASYWYWYYDNFAPTGPTGTWRYEIVFNGSTYTHEFAIVDPDNVPSSTPSATRTITPTRTITSTRTITPTPSETRTPSTTFTPTATRTPSNTFTPSATRTPSSTWTPSPTRTVTVTPPESPSPTATTTDTIAEPPSTSTPTQTTEPTNTLEPTATFTAPPTDTPVPTATTSDTPTPTSTPTSTAARSATPTMTSTDTASTTATDTDTPPPTATATSRIAITATPRDAATPAPSATATHSITPTFSMSPTQTVTVLPTATAAARPVCRGDCGADGAVSVSDLVRAVNIALGKLPLDNCRAATASNTVAINDLVTSVNNALHGCP